ncbi:MAG: FAD-dependent oxidoreductase [Promethearchaeota archaeon]
MSQILVIGGGTAGMHTAIALAEMGIKVDLVEKERSIGGILKDLGFVFPSDDCALCYESANTIFGDNQIRKCQYRAGFEFLNNLKIHSFSQISQYNQKKGGKIAATIVSEPLLIDPAKCVLCGACQEVCSLKAISKCHIQAIPSTLFIDPTKCDPEKCKKECLEACKLEAIDLQTKPKETLIDFDAVILASGFNETCPPIESYAIDEKEVINQIELAHKLDPTRFDSGLDEGIKTVVMVQCVGSRDPRFNAECSSLCCTYALKHAIKLKELGIENVIILYMDIRTLSILENYYIKARNTGVKFVRGRPGLIEKREKKLLVHTENTLTGTYEQIEADLVVLSTGLEKVREALPSKGHTFWVGATADLQNIPQCINDARSKVWQVINSLN